MPSRRRLEELISPAAPGGWENIKNISPGTSKILATDMAYIHPGTGKIAVADIKKIIGATV
jgi:hypothetical protein